MTLPRALASKDFTLKFLQKIPSLTVPRKSLSQHIINGRQEGFLKDIRPVWGRYGIPFAAAFLAFIFDSKLLLI